jgi:hypothetical protein
VPACLCEIGKASLVAARLCLLHHSYGPHLSAAKLLWLRHCEGLIGNSRFAILPNMHSAAQRAALACVKPEQRHVAALE